ncbi:uncharacterized protein [Amphiura filiformis]|uniref:uncharacterized protein isoform X2 n=1 Tax=Amphiura filiformis TaxID=82378 RepID=UPI003B20FCE5
MSREYRVGSAVYSKPDKKRSEQKYDTRQDAYRLYQHERPTKQQAHYNSHYVYDNRQPSGHDYRRPVAQQDHYNAHLIYDNRQSGGHEARYVAKQDREGRYAAAAQQEHYNHQYGQVHGHEERGRVLSNNRLYPVQPLYRQDVGPPGAPHPHHQYKDYSRNPLQELFQPPEGHKEVHTADVHAEATAEVQRPDAPEPPLPPEPPLVVEEDQHHHDHRKPRKVREYRIRKKKGGGDKDDDDKEEDSDKDDKRRKDKKKPAPTPENWYTQTHPAKFIKLGDITYVRAKTFEKKRVESLMSGFEAFGFVIIGVLYKGGNAILKIVAPIAAIKAYTSLLSPVLQSMVSGITAGITGK